MYKIAGDFLRIGILLNLLIRYIPIGGVKQKHLYTSSLYLCIDRGIKMEIDTEKIKRQKVAPDKLKNIKVVIRINKEISQFLNDKKISPTGLFYEALKVVGYKSKPAT